MEKQRDELFRFVSLVDDMYDFYKDFGGKIELKVRCPACSITVQAVQRMDKPHIGVHRVQ